MWLATGMVAHAQTTDQASVPGLMFDRWTVEHGLPINHLVDLAIGPDERVWVATFEGLARLDGLSVTRYQQAVTPGLTANRFTTVEVARDGAAWTVSEVGEVFRIAHGSATRIQADALDPVDVHELQGELWVLGRKGIARVVGDELETLDLGEVDGLMVSMALDRDGSLWVGTDVPPQVLQYSVTEAGVQRERVVPLEDYPQRLLPDRSLWISGRRGIWRLKADGALTRELSANGGRVEMWAERSSEGQVWVRHRDEARAWIWDGEAMVELGADAVPPDAGLAANWRTHGNRIALGDSWVFDAVGVARVLSEDVHGLPWLEDRTGGLLHARAVPFRPVGLESLGAVQCVIEAVPGEILACVRTGVARVRGDAYEYLDGPGTQATALAIDTDGVVLASIGTTLCRLIDDRCEPVRGWDDLEELFGIAVLDDGGLWTAGPAGVHQVTRDQPDRITSVTRRWRDPRAVSRGVEVLDDGTALVTTRGAGLLHVRADEVVSLGPRQGLPNSSTRGMHLDETGHTWFGTEGGGLCRIRTPDGEPLQAASLGCLSVPGGLPFGAINSVTEDDQGRLWGSGNGGVFYVPRESAEQYLAGELSQAVVVAYGGRDGLVEPETNGRFTPAVIRSHDGNLWYPTMRGLAELATDEVPRVVPPPVHIERITVDDQDLTAAGVGEGRLELTSDAEVLAVSWTAVAFTHPEQLRFRARLRGVDSRWREGDSREAVWSPLPPGTHTLELQSGWAGVWGPVTPAITVVRPPRWTERAWLPPLVGLLGSAMLLLAGVWRVRAALRRGRELETAVAERTEELAQTNTRILAQANQLAERNTRIQAQADELVERNARIAAQAGRLEALDVARTRFVANISHELRTPLSLIRGPLEQLLDAPLPPEQARMLTYATRGTHRLHELVDQLIDVARLQAGGVPLRARRLDLGAMLRRITALFQATGEGPTVRVHTPSSPVQVWADADLLEKVVTNLVGNAVKFTPASGEVDVSLVESGAEVRVSVVDTGPGIQGDVARVFESFYQTPAGEALPSGAGIGLSLAKELVELHGGQIGAVNRDRGAEFWFVLPLGADHIAVDELDLSSPLHADIEVLESGEEGPDLLVVEDHPDMRSYLAEQLSAWFQVRAVVDGVEALAAISERVPDAVVSDVMMPRMDGLELCRRLKEDDDLAGVPVILISAKSTEADRVQGLSMADDYVAKPFSMRVLASRVNRLLGRSESEVHDDEGAWPVAGAEDMPEAAADRAFVQRLAGVVEAHLANRDFTVALLSKKMALSPRQLQRRTSDTLGVSPAAVLRESRMRVAQRLMEAGTAETVAEVAVRVGMSPAYFSRVFSNWAGHTPSEALGRRDSST